MISQWNCLHCGECCKKLSVNGKVSLSLMPDEKDLFPPELVKPAIAIGDSEDSLDILYYQMIKEPCLHLKDNNECSIYVNRPVLCTAWPLSFQDGQIHVCACTAITGVGMESVTWANASNDLKVALNALKILMENLKKFDDMVKGKNPFEYQWIWDLQENRWMRASAKFLKDHLEV